MNDTIRTIIAAGLEIGIPIGLLATYKFLPSRRKRLIVILGSLTPISVTYLVFFLILPWLPENRNDPYRDWALGAMPVMSFVVFAASLCIGILLAFLKKPEGLAKRYFMGVIAPLTIACIEFFHKHNHL